MFFVSFDLARDGTPLRKVMRGILGCALLFLFGPFVFHSQLERTADLLDEACEFFGRLGCNSLDISLKDKEVLRFDEDAVLHKRFVVRSVRDGSFVQLVFRSPSPRNPSGFVVRMWG